MDFYETCLNARENGLVNMLDRNGVMDLLKKFGYVEIAKWVKEHKSEYSRIIFEGMEIERGELIGY